jgi:hypothetical protein
MLDVDTLMHRTDERSATDLRLHVGRVEARENDCC